jgi:hypothetical protein
MQELNDYERQQIQAIDAWKIEEPGVASHAFGSVVEPLVWLVQKVVPESAIQGAIEGASVLGQYLTDTKDILRDAQVENIADLRTSELALCDKLADEVHNWAIGIAMAEGSATGALGILGAPVDVPAIITIAMRTIHKIGVCYGYERKTPEDGQFALSVLGASGANTVREKLAALATLTALRTVLARQSWKVMAEHAAQNQFGKEAILVTIRNLGKQIGINVTKRRALAAIPAIGAVVGGSVNGWYIKEVGWAARRAFQERWLVNSGKLLAGAETT